MKVYYKEKPAEINFEGKTVMDLLKQMNIPSNTVIVVRNGTLILESEEVRDSETIHILSAVSGG
jgi:sulfur carrier protein ThiS